MSLTKQAVENIMLGKGGSYGTSRDALKDHAYDVVKVPTTIGDQRYFTQPLGSSFDGGVKTLIETNLDSNSQFPKGQTFLIQKMWLHLIAPIEADSVNQADLYQAHANLMQSSVFSIVVAGREYDYRIPGAAFVPTVALAGDGPADTTSSNQFATGNFVASGCSRLDPTPIFINDQVSFHVSQQMDNASSTITTILNANAALLNGVNARWMVRLEGFRTRPK